MNTSTTFKSSESPNSFAEQAAQSADQAIKSTQRAANGALDSLANKAQRGVDAVRDGSHQLRDKAQRASEGTVKYIKGEPVKAMLIAAAVGATVMATVGLMSRSRKRGRSAAAAESQ